ncbi:MAG: DUF4149 domain-containing protein [Ramlibacter sp.]
MARFAAGWKARVPVLAASLWWGSLATTGFTVVPLLFAYLPTTALAGQVAARLFTAQTWVSCGCGVMLLLASRTGDDADPASWLRASLAFVVGGLLLALIAEFGVAPRIVARESLKLWHSVGSAMYLAQWLCSSVILWRATQVRSAGPS